MQMRYPQGPRRVLSTRPGRSRRKGSAAVCCRLSEEDRGKRAFAGPVSGGLPSIVSEHPQRRETPKQVALYAVISFERPSENSCTCNSGHFVGCYRLRLRFLVRTCRF